MNLNSPLDSLIPKSLERVLYRLAVLPEGESGRRIHELTGNPTLHVTQGHLNTLADIGLVNVRRLGGANLYQLNRSHILWDPIENLFNAPARVEQTIAERFTELAPGDTIAIFGSFARHEATNESDIDLLVVWDAPTDSEHRAEILDVLREDIARVTGNPVQIIDVDNEQLIDMATARDPLTTSWLNEARTLTATTPIADRIRMARLR